MNPSCFSSAPRLRERSKIRPDRSKRMDAKRTCDGCSDPVLPGDPDKSKLVRCSRCQDAWYHNRDCQRAHYPQHRHLCKQKAAALRTSGEATDGSKSSVSSCSDTVVATAFNIDKRIASGMCIKHWANTTKFPKTEYRLICSDKSGMIRPQPPDIAFKMLTLAECIPTEADLMPHLSIRRWDYNDGVVYIISTPAYMPTWDAICTCFKDVQSAGTVLSEDPQMKMGTVLTWTRLGTKPEIFRLH